MFPALKNGLLPLFSGPCRVFVTRLMTFVIISGLLVTTTVYSQSAKRLDATKQKNILIIGDSLSAAYKLSREEGWPYLLQTKLQSQGLDYRVVNASVSGATTAAGLHIMPKALQEHQPHIVIIGLGGNDGLQGKPVSYIRKNLAKLVSMAQDSGAQVLLTGIRLPPNFGARYTEPFYRQYGELAKKYDVVFLPFLLEGVAGNGALMMDDGIHPSAAGQPLVLHNVWPFLAPLVASKSP